MSLSGHFRPIQRGFAMSGYLPEADVETLALYDGVDAPDGIDVPKWRC
jgi:hypothetical protein